MSTSKLALLPGPKPSSVPKPAEPTRARLILMPSQSTSPADLVFRVKKKRPGAFEELYEMVLEITRAHAASDCSERQILNRADDLMNVALETVFEDALSRPGAMPDLIRTLARLPGGSRRNIPLNTA